MGIAIDPREQGIDGQLAAQHAAAEDRCVEARAFLVDHAADRERAPRAGGAAPHGLHRNERGHDAERPVERTAVEHGVHV